MSEVPHVNWGQAATTKVVCWNATQACGHLCWPVRVYRGQHSNQQAFIKSSQGNGQEALMRRSNCARLLIEFCSASCGESFLFSEVTFEFLFYSRNQMIYLLNCLHSWCSRPYSLNIIRLRYWKHIQMTLRIMFLWLKLHWKQKSLCFLHVVQ